MRYVGRTFTFRYPEEFTTLPEYDKHRNHTVKVTGRIPWSRTDSLMFYIECADGWHGEAWPDELVSP